MVPLICPHIHPELSLVIFLKPSNHKDRYAQALHNDIDANLLGLPGTPPGLDDKRLDSRDVGVSDELFHLSACGCWNSGPHNFLRMRDPDAGTYKKDVYRSA